MSADIGLRVLSPRAVLLGTGDPDALQNLDTTELPDGALCWVSDQTSYYVLHRDSSAAPSGSVIVAPGSGPGRWFQLVTGSSGAQVVVPNIAALAAIAAPANGESAFVLTVRSGFTFALGSALTADGISIVNSGDATGQWIRSTAPSLTWAYQAAWFLDSSTGNDENVGNTSLTALKTAAELVRRIDRQTLQQKTVVTQLTDLNEWVKLHIQFVDSAADTQEFQWLGGTLTSLHTGQLSGVTALDANSNVPEKVADGALVWTPFIGQRIRLTDGANAGATAWIVKNEGAGVARVSNFQLIDPNSPVTTPALVQPSIGNHYQIDQMVALNGLELRVSRLTTSSTNLPFGATVDSIDFGRGLASPNLSQILFDAPPLPTQALISRCRMASATLATVGGTLLDEQGCCAPLSATTPFARCGQIATKGGATIGSWLTGNFSYFKIGGYHLIQGGQLRVNGLIDVNGGVQVFDSGANDAVLVFDADAQLILSQTATSPVSGSGNGATGIKIWGGANAVHFGTVPTITGSVPGTNDLSLCNTAPTNFSWAAVSAAPNKSVTDTTRLTGFVQR